MARKRQKCRKRGKRRKSKKKHGKKCRQSKGRKRNCQKAQNEQHARPGYQASRFSTALNAGEDEEEETKQNRTRETLSNPNVWPAERRNHSELSPRKRRSGHQESRLTTDLNAGEEEKKRKQDQVKGTLLIPDACPAVTYSDPSPRQNRSRYQESSLSSDTSPRQNRSRYQESYLSSDPSPRQNRSRYQESSLSSDTSPRQNRSRYQESSLSSDPSPRQNRSRYQESSLSSDPSPRQNRSRYQESSLNSDTSPRQNRSRYQESSLSSDPSPRQNRSRYQQSSLSSDPSPRQNRSRYQESSLNSDPSPRQNRSRYQESSLSSDPSPRQNRSRYQESSLNSDPSPKQNRSRYQESSLSSDPSPRQNRSRYQESSLNSDPSPRQNRSRYQESSLNSDPSPRQNRSRYQESSLSSDPSPRQNRRSHHESSLSSDLNVGEENKNIKQDRTRRRTVASSEISPAVNQANLDKHTRMLVADVHQDSEIHCNGGFNLASSQGRNRCPYLRRNRVGGASGSIADDTKEDAPSIQSREETVYNTVNFSRDVGDKMDSVLPHFEISDARLSAMSLLRNLINDSVTRTSIKDYWNKIKRSGCSELCVTSSDVKEIEEISKRYPPPFIMTSDRLDNAGVIEEGMVRYCICQIPVRPGRGAQNEPGQSFFPKQIKTEDSSSTKRIKTEDSSSTKRIKTEDSSSTKRIKTEDSSSTKRIKTEDSSSTKQIKSEDCSSPKQIRTEDSSSTKQIKTEASSSTKQIKSEDSSSTKQIKSEDSSSTKQIKTEECSSTKRIKTEDSSSTKQIKFEDCSSPKQIKSEDCSSTKQIKSEDCSSTKQIKSEDCSSTKQIKSEDCSSPKQIKSEDCSSTKQIKSEDSSSTKQIKSEDSSSPKQIKSEDSSSTKQIKSEDTSSTKQRKSGNCSSPKQRKSETTFFKQCRFNETCSRRQRKSEETSSTQRKRSDESPSRSKSSENMMSLVHRAEEIIARHNITLKRRKRKRSRKGSSASDNEVELPKIIPPSTSRKKNSSHLDDDDDDLQDLAMPSDAILETDSKRIDNVSLTTRDDIKKNPSEHSNEDLYTDVKILKSVQEIPPQFCHGTTEQNLRSEIPPQFCHGTAEQNLHSEIPVCHGKQLFETIPSDDAVSVMSTETHNQTTDSICYPTTSCDSNYVKCTSNVTRDKTRRCAPDKGANSRKQDQCSERKRARVSHTDEMFLRWKSSIGNRYFPGGGKCAVVASVSNTMEKVTEGNGVCPVEKPDKTEERVKKTKNISPIKCKKDPPVVASNNRTVQKSVVDNNNPSVQKSVAFSNNETVEKSIDNTNKPTVQKSVVDTNSPTVPKSVAFSNNETVQKSIVDTNKSSVQKSIAASKDPYVQKSVVDTNNPYVQKSLVDTNNPYVQKSLVDTNNTPVQTYTGTIDVNKLPIISDSQVQQQIILQTKDEGKYVTDAEYSDMWKEIVDGSITTLLCEWKKSMRNTTEERTYKREAKPDVDSKKNDVQTARTSTALEMNESPGGTCNSLEEEQLKTNESPGGTCNSLEEEELVNNESPGGACNSLEEEVLVNNESPGGTCNSLEEEVLVNNESTGGACNSLEEEELVNNESPGACNSLEEEVLVNNESPGGTCNSPEDEELVNGDGPSTKCNSLEQQKTLVGDEVLGGTGNSTERREISSNSHSQTGKITAENIDQYNTSSSNQDSKSKQLVTTSTNQNEVLDGVSFEKDTYGSQTPHIRTRVITVKNRGSGSSLKHKYFISKPIADTLSNPFPVGSKCVSSNEQKIRAIKRDNASDQFAGDRELCVSSDTIRATDVLWDTSLADVSVEKSAEDLMTKAKRSLQIPKEEMDEAIAASSCLQIYSQVDESPVKEKRMDERCENMKPNSCIRTAYKVQDCFIDLGSRVTHLQNSYMKSENVAKDETSWPHESEMRETMESETEVAAKRLTSDDAATVVLMLPKRTLTKTEFPVSLANTMHNTECPNDVHEESRVSIPSTSFPLQDPTNPLLQGDMGDRRDVSKPTNILSKTSRKSHTENRETCLKVCEKQTNETTKSVVCVEDLSERPKRNITYQKNETMGTFKPVYTQCERSHNSEDLKSLKSVYIKKCKVPKSVESVNTQKSDVLDSIKPTMHLRKSEVPESVKSEQTQKKTVKIRYPTGEEKFVLINNSTKVTSGVWTTCSDDVDTIGDLLRTKSTPTESGSRPHDQQLKKVSLRPGGITNSPDVQDKKRHSDNVAERPLNTLTMTSSSRAHLTSSHSMLDEAMQSTTVQTPDKSKSKQKKHSKSSLVPLKAPCSNVSIYLRQDAQGGSYKTVLYIPIQSLEKLFQSFSPGTKQEVQFRIPILKEHSRHCRRKVNDDHVERPIPKPKKAYYIAGSQIVRHNGVARCRSRVMAVYHSEESADKVKSVPSFLHALLVYDNDPSLAVLIVNHICPGLYLVEPTGGLSQIKRQKRYVHELVILKPYPLSLDLPDCDYFTLAVGPLERLWKRASTRLDSINSSMSVLNVVKHIIGSKECRCFHSIKQQEVGGRVEKTKLLSSSELDGHRKRLALFNCNCPECIPLKKRNKCKLSDKQKVEDANVGSSWLTGKGNEIMCGSKEKNSSDQSEALQDLVHQANHDKISLLDGQSKSAFDAECEKCKISPESVEETEIYIDIAGDPGPLETSCESLDVTGESCTRETTLQCFDETRVSRSRDVICKSLDVTGESCSRETTSPGLDVTEECNSQEMACELLDVTGQSDSKEIPCQSLEVAEESCSGEITCQSLDVTEESALRETICQDLNIRRQSDSSELTSQSLDVTKESGSGETTCQSFDVTEESESGETTCQSLEVTKESGSGETTCQSFDVTEESESGETTCQSIDVTEESESGETTCQSFDVTEESESGETTCQSLDVTQESGSRETTCHAEPKSRVGDKQVTRPVGRNTNRLFIRFNFRSQRRN